MESTVEQSNITQRVKWSYTYVTNYPVRMRAKFGTSNYRTANTASGGRKGNAGLAGPLASVVGSTAVVRLLLALNSILKKALEVLKTNEAVFNIFVESGFMNTNYTCAQVNSEVPKPWLSTAFLQIKI